MILDPGMNLTLRPMQYPDLYEMYKNGIRNTWTVDEVDFQNMESRICKGLYFAGEILDIDGLTGGFNFQHCWTSGWLAGKAIAKSCK